MAAKPAANAPPANRVTSAPVVGGIIPSIGYVYDDTAHLDSALGGDPDLYVYGRYGNPTVSDFEKAIVDLECHDMPDRAGEHFALATGSGMSAIHLAMAACGVQAGATVAAAQDCYGATYSLVDSLWPQYGVKASSSMPPTSMLSPKCWPRTRPVVLVVETISNPLLKIVDIPRLAQLCRAHNTLLLVDNTFATPMLFRPLAHGVDVVIHSATKYIGGHGDVLGGVVAARNELRPAFWDFLKKTGANLGPHEAWLLHRGLKTMPLRVERQCRNAAAVAEQLSRHPALAHVRYPGLPDHPQHELAGRLFGQRGYGAVVAIELKNAGQRRCLSLSRGPPDGPTGHHRRRHLLAGSLPEPFLPSGPCPRPSAPPSAYPMDSCAWPSAPKTPKTSLPISASR